MKLAGKTAVVTGAARGIGRAYALRLAALGADVAIIDIDLAGAAKFSEQLSAATVADEIRAAGRQSVAVQADLGRRDEADRAIREIYGAFGRIDIIVNNAGGALTPMKRSVPSLTPDDDMKLLFDVNFHSMVYCCQAVIPQMKDNRSGVIVNISSQTGVSVFPGGVLAAYGTAKAAVTHYTRYLAAELGLWGIRANCIAPGIIMTAAIAAQGARRGLGTDEQKAAIPLGRFGTPEDCAGVIEFLTTDLSSYVTGQCICVDGGTILTPS